MGVGGEEAWGKGRRGWALGADVSDPNWGSCDPEDKVARRKLERGRETEARGSATLKREKLSIGASQVSPPHPTPLLCLPQFTPPSQSTLL